MCFRRPTGSHRSARRFMAPLSSSARNAGQEVYVVRRRLLAIAVASFACSSHAAEHLKQTARLPSDLPEPSIVRQAEGSVIGPDGKPVVGALISVIDRTSYRGVGFSVSDRDGRFSVGLPSAPVIVAATAN